MLSGMGYPSGENYPTGTGMELFFYSHAGTGNLTDKILRVRVRVRVGTTRRVRTRCHLHGRASQRSGVPTAMRGGETSGGGGWDGRGLEDERGRRPWCLARSAMASTAAAARAREGERKGAPEGETEGREAWRSSASALEELGRVARRRTCVCLAWSPWRQIIEHLACSKVAKVGRRLGCFWAKLVHGLKTKFVVPLMLYKFH
jgi:hypothetical protein